MKAYNDGALKNYAVTSSDREYNIWLRAPLAIRVFSREMAAQKLDYMHLNPMQPHWLSCTNPADYRFLSAIFFEQNINEFNSLTHFGEVFWWKTWSVKTPDHGAERLSDGRITTTEAEHFQQ